jgi:hypothetical protein
MATLVVTLAPPGLADSDVTRLDIFPGGATPSIYRADTPFWIGYGFAADPGRKGMESALGDAATRFELVVDGKPVATEAELELDGAGPVRKTDLAVFPSGLPAGWHDFVGRWYDEGRLVLSSRASIEFVER